MWLPVFFYVEVHDLDQQINVTFILHLTSTPPPPPPPSLPVIISETCCCLTYDLNL